MNSKVMNIIKSKSYVVPSYLLKSYSEFGLSSDMFIVMIYLLNVDSPIICDYKKIGEDLGIDTTSAMNRINDLVENKLVEIKMEKNDIGKLEEYIDLDIFYNKLFLNSIEENEESSNIYSLFETEFGRTLSPIEYELISGWSSNYKEEIILEALKEAVYNGVTNFRYIDKILFEWNKKGIDSIDKISKNKKEYKKNTTVEVPDYDWLNDE